MARTIRAKCGPAEQKEKVKDKNRKNPLFFWGAFAVKYQPQALRNV
jgi:hypothetical protein